MMQQFRWPKPPLNSDAKISFGHSIKMFSSFIFFCK